MGRRLRDIQFFESAVGNNRTYNQYLRRLTDLALSVFEWKNLPDSVDARFLELTLFTDGQAVFFRDEVLGELALQCMIGGEFNVYRIPTNRVAYATNGYQKHLTEKDSVIIYNNRTHTNSTLDVEMFARRLYDLDRTIDVNARAQKTPILIQCEENQRLTMKNLYKQYDGNEPFIFGNKSLDLNGLSVLQTGAPYVCDKLYELKTQYWNEALTYLGIPNVSYSKRERMVTDEVNRGLGGVIASRYSRLDTRQEACEQINRMFGLDIWCDFKSGLGSDDFSEEEGEEIE